jgi:hypothetical protein
MRCLVLNLDLDVHAGHPEATVMVWLFSSLRIDEEGYVA